MIDVVYYLFNAFGISTKPGRLMLPKQANVSEERFNEILSTVTEAKNNRLKINVDGREITLDSAESLLKGVGSGKIDKREFKKKYNNIVDDIEKISNRPHTRSQENMVKILSLLKEISKSKDKTTDEQPDTTHMSELESEESAAQKRNLQGKGLKILTPNQMLCGLTNFFSPIKEIIQKNLKMKLGSYYILCADQKNLQKISIRV